MKKKVVAVVVIVALLAVTGYCSFFGGVQSQRGTITQLTTDLETAKRELESVKKEAESTKRDKQILVGIIKRNNLQNYFNGVPLGLRMELDKPMTLLEQYALY